MFVSSVTLDANNTFATLPSPSCLNFNASSLLIDMPFAKLILNVLKSSLTIVVPSGVPDGGVSIVVFDVMFSDNVILDPEILATVMFDEGSITPETNTLSPTLIPSVFEIVITFAVI